MGAHGLNWDAREIELEDGLVVLGWNNMTDEDVNNIDSWVALPATSYDGEELFVAVPKEVALKQNLIEQTGNGFEVVSTESVWDEFSFSGFSDWDTTIDRELEKVPDNGTIDFREEYKKTLGKEPIKIGTRCFDHFEEVFGNDSVVDSVTRPYQRFIQDIDKIIKENGIFEDPISGMTFTLSAPRLDMEDTKEAWANPKGEDGITKRSCFHHLYCDLKISVKAENGKDVDVYTKSNFRLMDILAMNYERGLFLYNGDEYAVANQADPNFNNRRIKTAGMVFREVVKDGVASFFTKMQETLYGVAQNRTDIKEALASAKDLNANDPMKELLRNEGKHEEVFRRVGATTTIDAIRSATTVLIKPPVTEDGEEKIADLSTDVIMIICPVSRPNGEKITKSGSLTNGVRIDDRGVPYGAFYKVDKGKIDTSDVLWMPIHKVFDSYGNEITEGEMTADECILGHPGDFNEQGNGFITRYDTTAVFNRGDYSFADRNSINLVAVSPSAFEAAGVASSSFMYEVREAIWGSNLKQVVPPDPENAATLGPLMSKTPELLHGSAMGTISRAEGDGVIKDIQFDLDKDGKKIYTSMTIGLDNGGEQFIKLGTNNLSGEFHLHQETPGFGLEIGSRVENGQIVTDSDGICAGEAIIGLPALVAVVPAGAGITDDAILVTEEFAKKYQTDGLFKGVASINTGVASSPYGPEIIYNPLIGAETDNPFLAGYDCSKLGPDGIVKDGEYLQPGDVIAWVAKSSQPMEIDKQRSLVMPDGENKFKLPEGFEYKPIIYNERVPGRVHVKHTEKNGKTILSWESSVKKSLETGDKVSIEGVKGVVIVIKDMPRINCPGSPTHGKKVDMIVNATSYMNRQAPGPLIEGLAAFAALNLENRIDIPQQTRGQMEALVPLLKQAGLPTDGRVLLSGELNGVNLDKLGLECMASVIVVSNVNHAAIEALRNEGKGLMNPMAISNLLGKDVAELMKNATAEDMNKNIVISKTLLQTLGLENKGVESKKNGTQTKTNRTKQKQAGLAK